MQENQYLEPGSKSKPGTVGGTKEGEAKEG